ncbi:MAG: sigma-70 family RNA polymerase sigma factor [Deltaproteobacteria bacterium]|nr:MAG: sigma-70 family RNA polymerase sigma factor [Deltaproteobacteria bacterium]
MSDDRLCNADELIALLQSGDIDVLDRVTRCFGERLAAEGRRRCNTLQDADDAVQEAALAAWRYGPGFRGEGSVERWLVRLVATACNRMRRGMKRDPSLHVTDVELSSADAGPDVLAARGRLAEALGQSLLALPPRDRAIVILSDAQGMTSPEIADALSMTPGAVRTRLSRAHKRLRAELDAAGLPAATAELSSADA